MTESPPVVQIMAEGTPMTSDYDSHSSVQMEANARNLQPLTQALLAVSPLSPSISIADFGSATGLNSMKTFSAAIKEFRETDQKEVFVFHVDLPGNAWDVLFKNAATSPHSYLTIPGTFVSGIGRSNFDRLFPSDFLSIGYSTFSLHWLSRRAAGTQQLQRFCANAPELLTELSAIAREDLETFLRHRAEELRVGGRLLIQSPVSKLELDAFYEAIAGMVASGSCTSAPLDSFAIPWHLRTEEEFLEVVRKFPQFRVAAQVLTETADPFFRKYQEDGDLATYAKTIVQSSRAATESLFATLFNHEDALVEEFYRRVETYTGEHPHAIHSRQLLLVLEKVE